MQAVILVLAVIAVVLWLAVILNGVPFLDLFEVGDNDDWEN